MEKECLTCKEKYSTYGRNCRKCLYQFRQEKHKKIPCSGCGRKGFVKINIGLNLCNTCVRNKRDSEIPGYKQKRLHVNMMMHRKYRGTPLYAPKREKNGIWKDSYGYIMTWSKDHPNRHVNGTIPMHKLIMSQHLGRPLTKNESVHHKNGIKDDNRIENLELWHRGQPAGQRLDDKIDWAKKFLIEYGYNISKI